MVVLPNTPDLRFDQALEQQRRIRLRFQDLQSWLQRLTARGGGLQNRLLDLQLAQDRSRSSSMYISPSHRLNSKPKSRHHQSSLYYRCRLSQQRIYILSQNHRQPPPDSQSVPTAQEQFNHQQQQQDLLTEDDDENPPHHVQPCRQAKRTNPCYRRKTVAFSAKKTPKNKG
ncbi:unnamed protein product [Allacma fusca]|uniref:Uncharacterized protein n=1 Tax=Allacma fusca TaxID=39272 RepID=A0A8J2NZY4_9HEXA|nr:unnamed protein product [Allacma fusca]